MSLALHDRAPPCDTIDAQNDNEYISNTNQYIYNARNLLLTTCTIYLFDTYEFRSCAKLT